VSPGRDPQSTGRIWESRAARYLELRGMRIIARGYRCRLGELDIVACDERELVIVEVRARRAGTLGSALETVTAVKQRRIIRATRHFLMCHPAWHARAVRFDVIAIDGIDTPAPVIDWQKNAFDAS
jgi:putative endonuclease